ncbi:MAG: hypothetical protein ACJ73S_28115 [Mycobacteriales bacterium]
MRLLQAECLLALHQPKRALPKLEIAARYADDAALRERVDSALSSCLATFAEQNLEEVRGYLRAGDRMRALELLRAHERLYQGNEHYQDVLLYTAEVRQADPARLRRVLEWLTAEEVHAAQEALEANRFEETLHACRAAYKIDQRDARVAMLFARAILGQYTELVSQEPLPSLTTLRNYLTDARRWANEAGRDPQLRPVHDHLVTIIDAQLRRFDEGIQQESRLRRTNGRAEAAFQDERRRSEAARALLQRYDKFVATYYGTRLSRYDLDRIRSILDALQRDVWYLRNECGPNSPALRLLELLDGAIDHSQAQFRGR